MPKPRFIIDNFIDYASLQATNSTNTSYPVSNIARTSRGRVYRSDNTSTLTEIKGTYTEQKTASAIVIGRHNFSNDVYYRLYLYSDDNWTTQTYDSTLLQVTDEQALSDLWEWGEFHWGTIPWGGDKLEDRKIKFTNIVLWFDSPKIVQSFKLELSGPVSGGGGGSNPLYCNNNTIYTNNTVIYCNATDYTEGGGTGETGINYFEIGRIFLGNHIEPAYGISANHSISWDENTNQYRPSAGTLQSDISTINKRFEFSLNTIPESDRIDLHKQLLELGLSKDFFISIYTDDNSITKEDDYSGIVKLVDIPKYTQFLPLWYKSNYVIEEA